MGGGRGGEHRTWPVHGRGDGRRPGARAGARDVGFSRPSPRSPRQRPRPQSLVAGLAWRPSWLGLGGTAHDGLDDRACGTQGRLRGTQTTVSGCAQRMPLGFLLTPGSSRNDRAVPTWWSVRSNIRLSHCGGRTPGWHVQNHGPHAQRGRMKTP